MNINNIQENAKRYFRISSIFAISVVPAEVSYSKSLPKLIITILSLGLVITTLSINDVFSKPVKEGERCYTDGRKDSSGNYITTCCYASYDDGKFQGRFCEDCTIHDGGDVIICDDPYKESSRNSGNIAPHLNDNVIDHSLTEEQQPPAITNNRDTIIADRLSGSELEQAEPYESQDSELSRQGGIQSDSTGLGRTFNTQQENEDSSDEANDNRTS